MTTCMGRVNGFQSRLDRLEELIRNQAGQVDDVVDSLKITVDQRVNTMNRIIIENGNMMTQRINEAKGAMHADLLESVDLLRNSIATAETVFTDMVHDWGSRLDVKQETFSQQVALWKDELHFMMADISSRQRCVEKDVTRVLQRIPGPVQFGTMASVAQASVSRGRSPMVQRTMAIYLPTYAYLPTYLPTYILPSDLPTYLHVRTYTQT